MNVQKLKQFVITLVLALGFVIAPSLSNLSAVQAKDKKDKNHKEKRYDRDDDNDRGGWREREHRRRIFWLRHHRFGRYQRGFSHGF